MAKTGIKGWVELDETEELDATEELDVTELLEDAEEFDDAEELEVIVLVLAEDNEDALVEVEVVLGLELKLLEGVGTAQLARTITAEANKTANLFFIIILISFKTKLS